MTRFLKQAATAFIVFMAAVAALNVWVDPYRIWALRQGLSQDAPRPRAIQQERLLKSRGIARVRPVTVILGNSRAEIGFDPESAAWPAALRPVYNAAIPGSGVAVAAASLEEAIAAGHLQAAVIGVDFLDFLTDPDARPQPPPPPATATPAWRKRIGDIRLALSLDTLLDATLTVLQQANPYSADITSTGFNPLHEYEVNVHQEGYGSLFRQRDRENARAYVKLPKSVFFRSSATSDSWQALDHILTLSRRHHVSVKFVIYPYHAHILELFHHAGLYPVFEAWKKHLAEVAGDTSEQPDRGCTLWDFSGYSGYSTESVPPPTDRTTPVRWYWESGHFKRELGDRLLARMFDGESSLGVCLTPANVGAQNQRLRNGRERYVAESPATAAAMAKLFRAAVP